MEERVVAALAAKAKAGDASAFERLYSSHASSILFHVRSLLIDKESYFDVAQDVALEMFGSIQTLREPAAFRGWMHQIVRNVCATHNKKYLTQSKRVDLSEDDETLETVVDEGTEADPEALTIADLEGDWLYIKVSELPLMYREIILQFYYDEMSYKEIAETLGISVVNVSARLRRAMQAIRKKVGEASEGTGAPDKGTIEAIMREDQTYTHTTEAETPEDNLTVVTDPELEEKGLKDDIGLRNSLVATAALFASDDTTKAFLSSVHAKLIAATSATVASGAAGAAAATGKGITIIGYVLSALTLTAALALGGLAVYNQGGIDGIVSGTQTTKQTHYIQYEGDAHIIFADSAGRNTDHNVVSIQMVDEGPELVDTSWLIYQLAGGEAAAESGINSEYATGTGTIEVPGDATLLHNGSGNAIDTTVLSGLQPGSYQVVFTLQDTTGAHAQIARTFIITS